MPEPCTCTGIAATVTTTVVTSVVNNFTAKVSDYLADRAIEAYEEGWERDKAAGGISSWGDEPEESLAAT